MSYLPKCWYHMISEMIMFYTYQGVTLLHMISIHCAIKAQSCGEVWRVLLNSVSLLLNLRDFYANGSDIFVIAEDVFFVDIDNFITISIYSTCSTLTLSS